MICISNLHKQYRGHIALERINLKVSRGTIMGLLGQNGAGKTTLVSILNGLTPYREGDISIFGLDLRKNLREIRRRSSFVPQSFAFYDRLSVIENLRFFAGIQDITKEKKTRAIDYALASSRLDSMTDKRAQLLSGGQKQRLNIAIGLLNDPEIIYFDEPTAGIDPELRNTILATILSFKSKGKTIIYTSHYMQEIEQICDEVAIIHQGRILCHKPLKELTCTEDGEKSLESVFLQLTSEEKASKC